ncbi:MAG: RNase adapter RapZ [Cumulibacter sp.]
MSSSHVCELEVVLLTGFSGAGRSTAARVLEDLGFYVVDNLPPSMIPQVLQLAAEEAAIERVAIVTDVRSHAFGHGVIEMISTLKRDGVAPTVVFLDSAEDVLVRRFENVRRAHPLQGTGTITQGIAAERAMIEPLRGLAHLLLDTTDLSVHDLRRQLESRFDTPIGDEIRLSVMSFGFKYGVPLDADFVIDVRFLPNPFWIPELRALTGQDDAVSDYVLGQDGAADTLDNLERLVNTVLPGYRREGKRYTTIAVGCTGGKHRSVAMARGLAARLVRPGVGVHERHRDLGKE